MEKDNSMSKTLIYGLIIALFLLVGQSYMLTKVNNPTEKISVSGLSEMSVTPDEAEIYLTVTTENKDPKLAQEQNTIVSKEVIEALKAQGILAENIETLNYRLNEKYDYDYYYLNAEEKKEAEKIYEASHSIKVKTKDLTKIGSYVNTAITAGANGIDSVNYILSDEKEAEVRAQALEKAITAGTDKAKSMTKTMNVRLGKVITLTENNYYYTPYRYDANLKIDVASGSAAESLNYLAPQDVEVRSTVYIEFEIIN